MISFALFAILIIILVAAFLLPPLWFGQRRQQAENERKQANLVIFRDQLADLDREHAAGTLSAADLEQARTELQRRLLEDVAPEGEQTVANRPATSRKTALALVVALPLAAMAGYALLGNPRALDPAQTAPPPKQAEMTPEQINQMVERLADKLKANPDDTQGWLMLARSYKMLGRHDDAVNAYSKVEKHIQDNPDQLASYAEALAMANGQGLAGKPRALLAQALKIDPQHGHSLFLAGAAAFEAGDKKAGIAYWEALLPMVEPDSELDRMLRQGIDKMKQPTAAK